MFVRLLSACLMFAVSMAAGSVPAHASAPELRVCAVPQLHSAMNYLSTRNSIKFTLISGSSSALLDALLNDDGMCDVLLSSDERLPITLIRAGKAVGSSMIAFTRAPLVVWSQNPEMFKAVTGDFFRDFSQAPLTSAAVARPELTPPGFAANYLFKDNAAFFAGRTGRLYTVSNEYQVYSIVLAGNVDAGFVTRPLIIKNGTDEAVSGSFLEVPRRMYPDIQYYALLLESAPHRKLAQDFIRQLHSDRNLHQTLRAFGFASLAPDTN